MSQLPLFPLEPIHSSSKWVNHTDRLQALWNELCRETEKGQSRIFYQSYKGWRVLFHEPRYFEDEGDYLGWDYREADEAIRRTWKR